MAGGKGWEGRDRYSRLTTAWGAGEGGAMPGQAWKAGKVGAGTCPHRRPPTSLSTIWNQPHVSVHHPQPWWYGEALAGAKVFCIGRWYHIVTPLVENGST